MTKALKKILFMSEGQIGDMLLLTPALRALKKSYPECEVTVLLFHRRNYLGDNYFKEAYITEDAGFTTSELFYKNKNVDKIIEVNRKALRQLKGNKRIKAELSNIRYLCKQKYDAVILTFPQDRFLLWAFFARIKIRIGQKVQKMGYLLTEKISLSLPKSNISIVKYFCELIKPLGITADNFRTEFHISDEAEKWAEEFLSKHNLNDRSLVCVHPGSSERDRRLTADAYAKIIDNINQRRNFTALLCFSPYDNDFIDDIKKNLKNDCIRATPDSISKLGALLKRSSLCVVNNSGPRHLAAAVGSRTIAFLIKHDDRNWKIYEDEKRHKIIISKEVCPLCPPDRCGVKYPQGEINSAMCMRAINTDEVIQEINEMLDNS